MTEFVSDGYSRNEIHASGVFPNKGQRARLLDVQCAGALALPQTFRQLECTQEAWTYVNGINRLSLLGVLLQIYMYI